MFFDLLFITLILGQNGHFVSETLKLNEELKQEIRELW